VSRWTPATVEANAPPTRKEAVEVDLQLYFRVLWRFRWIMAVGIVLAIVLSFLSLARLTVSHGSPKVTYRQSETYQATVLLFLTQKGFPYGYTVLPYNPTKLGAAGATLVSRYADAGRFAQLSTYYAPFTHSDAYARMLRQRTQAKGVVDATAVVDPVHGVSEPFIRLNGFATNSKNAVALANMGAQTLIDYVVRLQAANKVPAAQRVELQVLSKANAATVATGRKMTTPIVVFLTVLLAAIGLSFILENLRPRVRPVQTLEDERQVQARRPA